MKHIISKKIMISLTGILAVLVILVVINIISDMAYFRVDVTENQLYSLSSGTRNMLKSLPEDVTLKLFYSASLAGQPQALKTYADRVKDLLREYENNSGGSIKLEIYDPKLDSQEEEWAQKYGVAANPINPLTYDELFFFGLVSESLDQTATIPILDPKREPYLEYDVSQLLYQVLHPRKKTLGVLSSLPVTGSSLPPFAMPNQPRPEPQNPWIIINELKKNYDVVSISTNITAINQDVDLLLVIHPKEFSDTIQYAIDQYVMNGGKAIFFVDPFCTIDMSASGMGFPMPGSSDLNRLFNAWGVNVPARKVVADMDNPTTIAMGNNRAEKNPAWINANGAMFNNDDVTSADLGTMIFPLAGYVTAMTNASVEMTTLIHTSDNAMEMDSQAAQSNAENIRRQFTPAGKPFSLAVKIKGKFKSAFPSGPPAGITQTNTYVPAGSAPNTLMIVTDVDMLADRFNIQQMNILGMSSFRQINNNYDFVMNAIDQFMGDQNLISVRSRATYDRPFTVVDDLEKQAQQKWLSHEKQFSDELQSVRQQIAQLQAQKDESQRMIITPEQQEEIKKLEAQRAELRKNLKVVRKQLNRDIERLGFKLKFLNMALMPILVSLFGIGLAIHRHYKVTRS